MDAPELLPRRWQTPERNTLLAIALVAALGLGCLGLEVQTVRHRQAMRQQIKAAGGVVSICDFESHENPFVPTVGIRPADRYHRISEIRRLLGDGKIGLIEFDRRLTAADREAIAAFPEAYVDGIPDSLPQPAQSK